MKNVYYDVECFESLRPKPQDSTDQVRVFLIRQNDVKWKIIVYIEIKSKRETKKLKFDLTVQIT